MSRAGGVVGLGPMGLAIASRVREGGVWVGATSRLSGVGFSVVAASPREPTRQGAHAAGIAVLAEARALGERVLWANGASRRSVVLTSLPAGPQVREACLGARGLLGGDEGGRAVL